MKAEEKHINKTAASSPEDEAPKRRRSLGARIAIASACTLGGVIILLILAIVGATYWLTPQRLSEIVNKEASENINADVKTHNIRFTIWSSWPHLRVEMDSMSVRSRVFDSLPANLRAQLPENADFLASSGKFTGGINILSLIKGEISLRDVTLGSLRLNLVALNDSLSNFNIFPSDTTKTRIPYFTANNVRLLNPGSIRYRSLANGADASVGINALQLKRVEKDRKKRDDYALLLLGKVNASVGDLSVLHGFPFELNGDVSLGFKPFRFSTSNYHVNLGALHGKVDMNMQVGGDSSLDAFSWHLDNFDLFRVLDYIPGMNLSALQSFDLPLNVNATARLTSPWRLSSTVLPSAEVDFDIEDGDMSYTTADGHTYTLRHEGAGGRLLFDGINPEASSFVIPPFHISGEGVDLTIGAGMEQLLGNPVAQASIEGEAGLKPLAAAFPFLKAYKLKGDVETDAVINAQLPPLSQLSSPQAMAQSQLNMAGKVMIRDFSGSFEGSRINTSGKSFELDFGGDYIDGNLPKSIAFSGKGEGLRLSLPGDTITLSLKDLSLKGAVATDGSGGDLKIGSSALALNAGDEKVDLSGISLDLKADKQSRPIATPDYKVPASWLADTASLAFAPHSSEFLQMRLPKKARDFIAGWRTALNLKIKNGVVASASFPAKNYIRNLDVAASFDSLVVRNIQFSSGSSSLAMRGSVKNLRQFLSSSTPAPLLVAMDVAMDTIQINQLARAFMSGKKGAAFSASPDAVQPDDTVATLLPRNIFADIRATAKETRYTNLHLYDLTTALHLRNGDLRVEDLRIGADFGHAFLNFDFTTSDIQDISMRADVGLMDVDVVRFFQRFHTLLLMMPEMKNLEGEVSAEANLSLLSFPNMYVNVPSVNADVRVQGDGLTVQQSPFIRHITRMLLIRENGPLHIADMDVHASIHDNLLELYPFTFSLDRYRLRMGGLNNFNGDLYYHIGVEKSPVPFPFGINIVGQFSHPKIRFGGAHWKIRKGEEITASVMELNKFNILAEGRKFLKEFLRKAAESNEQ